MKTFLFLFGFIFFNFLTSYNQDERVKEIIRDKTGRVKIIRFEEGKYDIPSISSINLVEKFFNTSKNDEFKIKSTNTDKLGTHVRYTQFYNGIKVENAEVIVHEKNGQIRLITGKIQQVDDLNIKPQLNKDDALQISLNHFNAKKYLWQDSINTIKLLEKEPAFFYPKPELVIWNDQNEKNYYLAYKIIIGSIVPLGSRTYLIDSNNGNILKWYDNAKHSDAVGQAVTRYSGTVNLHTDSYSGSYRLYDNSRNCNLRTINSQRQTGGSYIEFLDSDNNWNEYHNTDLDDAALDAHFAIQKTYDYFKTKFNRSSFDNNNHWIKIFTHYGVNNITSTWWDDLSSITLGDGDSTITSPVTSLDAIAHEFGHGVTSRYVSENESGEPSAIKEGLSDIWGACVENYVNISGNSPWIVGEDYHLFTSHALDLSDPNNSHYHLDWDLYTTGYPYPDTYNGLNWYFGGWDNYGEHINSSVLSHWFYLLANGKADTNEDGTYYVVSGIGVDDAAEIVYGFYDYITIGNGFDDICYYTKYIAEDLFGSNSNQSIQTKNAWYAVGLGNEVPNIITGNGPVCISSGATFSLPAEFEDTYVTWTKSDNITIQSGQGTREITATFNYSYPGGTGTLTATYNHGNGNIVSQTNVWVGDPPLPVITSTNQSYTIYVSGDLTLLDENVDTYGSILQNITNWTWNSDNVCCLYNMTPGYQMYYGQQTGTVRIRAYSENSCGTTYWSDPVYVDVIEEEGFSLFPNPASDLLTITIIKGKPLNLSKSSRNAESTLIGLQNYKVKIYNNMGVIQSSFTGSGEKFSIPLVNISNGLYIVEVDNGKTALRRQLIIKH